MNFTNVHIKNLKRENTIFIIFSSFLLFIIISTMVYSFGLLINTILNPEILEEPVYVNISIIIACMFVSSALSFVVGKIFYQKIKKNRGYIEMLKEGRSHKDTVVFLSKGYSIGKKRYFARLKHSNSTIVNYYLITEEEMNNITLNASTNIKYLKNYNYLIRVEEQIEE